MRNWKLWLGLSVAVIVFAVSLREHPFRISHQAPNPSIGSGDSLAGNYLSSRFAAQHDDPKAAAYYLSAAAKKDPSNLALLERSMKMKVLAGDIDAAVKDAEQYKSIDPKSFPASSILAIGAIKKGDFLKADEQFKSVLAAAEEEQQMNNLLLPILRAWVLLGQGRYPDARALLETLPEKNAIQNFILYQKALIADIGRQDQDAARAYDVLLQGEVRSYRLVQSASSFYLRIGRREKAEAMVANFNIGHPRLKIELSKDSPISNATDGVAEFLMETASLLYGRRLEESAMMYLNLALYLRSDLSYARYLLGLIQDERGDHDAAIRSFESIPKGLFYEDAQSSIVRALVKAERTEDAKRELNARIHKEPKDTEALSLLGDIALQAKDYRAAADYYTRVIEAGDAAQADRWAWYFTRGIAYERLNQWDKAEPDFTKALELSPNHPEVLNYLAYSWIIKGKNIERAKEMLETALTARPADAHIIDSYGWALYTLGDYENAVVFLERAVLLMSKDPTVNDHLGDVYWRLGRTREAKFQWERALTLKPEPEDETAIRKKLENGLPDLKPAASK